MWVTGRVLQPAAEAGRGRAAAQYDLLVDLTPIDGRAHNPQPAARDPLLQRDVYQVRRPRRCREASGACGDTVRPRLVRVRRRTTEQAALRLPSARPVERACQHRAAPSFGSLPGEKRLAFLALRSPQCTIETSSSPLPGTAAELGCFPHGKAMQLKLRRRRESSLALAAPHWRGGISGRFICAKKTNLVSYATQEPLTLYYYEKKLWYYRGTEDP